MKTALVTGANKGIGHEVVRQLAARGFHVFLGARRAEAGKQAAEDLHRPGAEVTFVLLDVTDPESIRKAAQELTGQAEKLDVLVNNAGVVLEGDTSVLELDGELLLKTMATNTLGALRVTQAFLPLLRKSAAPRVVNVSSGGGQLTGGADTWAPAYCISKTALNGVTCQLASALTDFAVNSVCPGWVRTDMGGADASLSVEEGADTIVWLATEAPQSLTAQFVKKREPISW